LVTFVLFSPVLCLFFLGGIYFGSTLVEQQLPVNVPNGLPGTRSILEKWNTNNLRGLNLTNLAPPVIQNFFRHNLPAESLQPPPSAHEHLIDFPELLPAQGGDSSRDILSPPIVPNAIPLLDSSSPSFPLVEDHPITGAEISLLLSSSLQIKENIVFHGPSDLDAPDVVIGAWVYLDELQTEQNMRTIFTNKQSGCENTRERNGIAMFVNEWGTNNHQLYVEYGNSLSGCNKVTSEGIQLHPKQWYHVGVTMVDTVTELYIDGTVVGRSDASMHTVQSSLPLVVGAFHEGDYSLYGNVSHLAISHPNQRKTEMSTSSVADAARKSIKKMMHIAGDRHTGDKSGSSSSEKKDPDTDGSELIALFEFNDFDAVVRKGSGNHETHDSISHFPGKYFFPEKLSAPMTVAGVPIKLVTGLSENHVVTEQMKMDSDVLARTRREEIKKAMQFVWSGYKTYAWGRDELKPMSNAAGDPWGGMGVTLVDSLDTLW
jgi:hypothetical protein